MFEFLKQFQKKEEPAVAGEVIEKVAFATAISEQEKNEVAVIAGAILAGDRAESTFRVKSIEKLR